MQFVSVHLTLFSTCGTPASDWAFFYSNPVSFLMLCFSLFCKLKKKKKPLLGNNWHKISCTYLKCTDVHTRIWAAITKHHRPAGIEQKCTVSQSGDGMPTVLCYQREFPLRPVMGSQLENASLLASGGILGVYTCLPCVYTISSDGILLRTPVILD